MADLGLSHTVLGTLALTAYVLAAALYVLNLWRPSPLAGRAATVFAVLAVILNFAALHRRAAALKTVPYGDLLGSMALFGFFLGLLNIVLELRHRDRSLGAFLIPTALVFFLASMLMTPTAKPPTPELRGSIFALHVTLNMLAYAAFAVACALSALYLVVRRTLKNVRLLGMDGPASRLPTLGYLERATRTSLGVGVLALAVGLGFGVFWAARVWGAEHPAWALDPKVVVALLTLVFYMVITIRAHRGAAPVTTARLTVAGFVLVLVSYTAINLLFSRLHVFT